MTWSYSSDVGIWDDLDANPFKSFRFSFTSQNTAHAPWWLPCRETLEKISMIIYVYNKQRPVVTRALMNARMTQNPHKLQLQCSRENVSVLLPKAVASGWLSVWWMLAKFLTWKALAWFPSILPCQNERELVSPICSAPSTPLHVVAICRYCWSTATQKHVDSWNIKKLMHPKKLMHLHSMKTGGMMSDTPSDLLYTVPW